ncbi:protein THYLAKOID ASSEMBLY 8-like, chloroplastic isoform X1 [Diospyros lotus]|uniref:protein THYLAKOID ASSEMBLY 8-like, chloroplastic isoform X1 n=1 Tax=Diospyros lotus TaxID=55363 RepID=UPI00224D4FD7|nr:protein THYLAKOID ASSEMBLY 8-like, chloroplastic isoform X1 [Diospyros lotus]XP_052193522.1 protein THYLAKOID ASSEMBLY 8-like, chloroplastic isoform X1 [Diospyros lotus]
MSFGVVAAIRRSKFRVFPSSPLFLSRILPSIIFSSDSSSSFQPPQSLFFFLTGSNGGLNRSVSLPRWSCRCYHDGRPRGPLWRSKKIIGKEALFVILCLKRFKDDQEKLDKFIKTHVLRLLKLDLIAVLSELQRQEEVSLALLIFRVIQKQDWYKPDVFLYKDLIIALSKCKKMDDATQLWEIMRKEGLFPDSQTYTEVIRGFLRCGSPADAMNIYEDMKNSPDPPEELPFRILLKGLLPHPLLRNRVKQDFEEIFPDSHMYDPPEEIFGLR